MSLNVVSSWFVKDICPLEAEERTFSPISSDQFANSYHIFAKSGAYMKIIQQSFKIKYIQTHQFTSIKHFKEGQAECDREQGFSSLTQLPTMHRRRTF